MINIIDKLWKYLIGYAIINIEGFNKMKLINKAVKKLIKFSDVTVDGVKATAIVSIEDLKKLYEINESYKCSIRITRVVSFKLILHRILTKYFFILGILSFITILFVLSNMIWLINISGNKELTNSDIIQACSNEGIELGKRISKLDCKEISSNLKNRMDNVAWINIRTQGATVFVKLAEEQKLSNEIKNENMPCDLVASADCEITSIVTNNGQPQVKKGDIVAKGDVLVSGQLVKSGNEEIEITNKVKSKAIIFGKVERIKKIDIPFSFQEKKYTGKVYNTYSLKIFNKKINVDFIDKRSTNSYDKSTEVKVFNLGKEYSLPLVLYNTKYKEYVINNIILSEKQAENRASKLIYNYIINTYPLDSDILNCKIKYVKSNNLLSAYAYITSNESVGIENYNIQFLGGNALNDST